MGDSLIEESTSPPFLFEAKRMLPCSFQKLFEFQQDEILCDVVIQVGRKTAKCHRAVLASCSPYFLAMFTSPLRERQQDVIRIGDIDEMILEHLIKFAYTARVELNSSNVQSLLHAASVLQLDDLVCACCEFMKLHLHPSNCIGIRQFVDRHGLVRFVKLVDVFTRRNFREVIPCDDFNTITASHLQDLISSSDLCVNSEIEVYEVVMHWVKHDVEKRKDILHSLLSYVRLPLIPVPYLQSDIETNDIIRSSLKCQYLINQAKDYHLWQAGLLPKVHVSNDYNKPRSSYAGMLFCVGGRANEGEPFASIECYSWFHDTWLQLADMSTKRRHVGCISVNGKILAVGGYNGQEHLSSAEIFQPLKNEWNICASMCTPRRGLGLCLVGGAVYAVGGLDDRTFFSTVERYDVASDIWSTVASMNIPRGGVAVVEFRGLMYALGGNDGPRSVSSCEVYDPHLDKWMFISPMSHTRSGAGAAVVDGFIYVVGGFHKNIPLNSVEKYDAASNTWVSVPPMNCCRGGVGVAALAGKIYAVGGYNDMSYLNTVEVYDPELDRWEFASNITESRAGAGVACCPCSFEDLSAIFTSKLPMKCTKES